MKYAESIRDIINAFNLYPLSQDDLERFYCDETMQVRTGDRYDSPILDIFEKCQIPAERNAYLLMGHRGCGKSTELNEMSARLKEKGVPVYTIPCGKNLDLMNPAYADLLILMGEALLTMAQENGCTPKPDAEKTIREFWMDVERERVVKNNIEAKIGGGAGVEKKVKETESKLLGLPLLKLFANASAEMRLSNEVRTTYREQIHKRIRDWLDAMNSIAEQITEKLDGRQPVIIFEELDKLEPEAAKKVFFNNPDKLTGVSFPVIYTFPIALSYVSWFRALEGYFQAELFPMIKLTYPDGRPFDEGFQIIHKIVQMRADLALFDEDALKLMITMTGGSLRDLFTAINESATRARRRGDSAIRLEDAERALEKQKSSLTRRIERKDYDFLVEICKGNRTNIEKREMLLEMLQSGVVLEYNGERWHNVHPLVAEFLKQQGLLYDE